MTWDLTEKRLRYIRTLAVRHGTSARELRVIDRLIDYVLANRRLPKTVNRRSVRSMVERMRTKA